MTPPSDSERTLTCAAIERSALKPEDKARWLKNLRKLAEEVDAANAGRQGQKISN
jgi:hypothetical protein